MNSNTQKNKVVSPPTFESKIARDREKFEEYILMLKKIKPKGWRKEVKDAKRWIKTFDRMEDLNQLDKLRLVCKTIIRRYQKQTKMAK